MPIGEKLEKLGFKKVQPFLKKCSHKSLQKELKNWLSFNSLVEIDERHKVGREIHIYEK